MAELGAYYITIMPSMKGFSSKVTKELKGLGANGGKDYSGGFLSTIKNSAIGVALGTMAVRAGDAIVGGISTGIDRADTLRNFPRVMEAMGYSADQASGEIQNIMERLRGLPASTQDVVRLTQAIADSTGDLDLAADGALAFTDAMIAQGASAGEVTQAQGVLNRILGKGNATVAQWQSLQSVMTPQLQAVSEELLGQGASAEELRDKLNKGEVSWNDFLAAMVKLDTEGNGHMKSFYEQAKANSDGIGTAIQNVTWRIGTGWAEILNAIGVDKISGTINATSDFISGAMSGIAGKITDLKTQLGETKAFENLQTIMKGLGERFGGFGDAVSGALDKAIPVLVDLIDKALQWIVDHGDKIGALADKIGEAFGGIAEKVGGALSAALPVLTDLVSNVLEWVLDHGDLVGTLMAGIVTAFLGFSTAQKAYDIVTGLPIVFGNLAEVLPLMTGLDDLPAALALVAEEGGPLTGIIGGLSEALGFLAANPIVLVVAGIAAIVGAFTWWVTQTEEGKKFFEDALSAIAGFFTSLWDDLKAGFNQIKQNLEDNKVQWEQFKKNVSTTVENIKKAVSDKWNELCDKFKEITDKIYQGVTGSIELMKTKLASIIQGIHDSAKDKWLKLKTTVVDTATAIKDTVAEKFNAAKDKVAEIFDGIKDGIAEKIQAAHDKIKEIVGKIKSLFDFDIEFPTPKLPHINYHMQDLGGFLSIPIFEGISWYANGGVFKHPTIIGVGDRGKEAAMPLNGNTYREIATGISQQMGAVGGDVNVTVTGNTFVVREEADIDRIADALAVRNARERRYGSWAGQSSFTTA